MEVEAVVKAIDGDYAVVELTRRAGGCGRCHEEGGCKSVSLSRPFGTGCRELRLPNVLDARRGEAVVLRLADAAALKSALMAYFMPVVLVVLGAAAGAAVPGGDGTDAAALAGALAGLCAALAWLRGFSRRAGAAGAAPVMARRGGAAN